MWLKRCAALVAAALVGVASTSPARAMSAPSRDAPLRAEIRNLVDADGVPGVVAVTSRDGRAARRTAAGLADIPAGRALRPDDRFRIASITKTFVAAVVLQLVTEHKLALDQPIAGLLPEQVPNAGKITVRELLDHASGLFDYSDDPRFDPGAPYTPAQLIALGTAHAPYFAPGTGFRYSSTNYIVLGEIVHRVTGRPIQDEVRTRLIRPLRLTGTTFPTATAVAPRQARGYVFAAPLPPRSGPAIDVTTRTSAGAAGAAAGMVSTGADVDRFLGALLGGGLFSRHLLTEMKRPTPGADAFFAAVGLPGIGYGLGLTIASAPCGTAYGSLGDIDGYTSSAMQFGHRRVTLLMNTNSLQPSLRRQTLSIAERELCRAGA
ncbi:serine hydrolase domain-containing protein [Actinomadura montaniterrae]|uniref:Beta-lactamase family protein n=1 Tax=Actinomadura montaniterrae TaxID=1803903 RepID=A0A6L3VWR6_9ACTN|nr:serine hydrolase domain-containing protein [Actinomadura montaniterrae]KAB2379470.1 beta-lactamase family protein [Actinomadura montaniterrae]